ncbi:helix-turn-helix transcriptional regulator [Cohnella mopanensis]|uniref:helix-turn-helix transcriptional regulator n=1 Tax=Cohnella mopanensis TaxID=2911966 RepID=UPI0034E2BE38
MDLLVFFQKQIQEFGLSPREQEVALHWMMDFNYKEISLLMQISELTTRTYIKNIHLKLGVNSKASLIIKVIQHGTSSGELISGMKSLI